MKGILVGVIAVICLISATSNSQGKGASELPCGATGTQAEANACARRDYQKAGGEMTALYYELMSELAGYGGGGRHQQKLRRAQASWARYRDATCESEASIYEGGSIRPAVYYSCMASVTRERVQRLKEFLAMTRQ
jgi:uncharacterized protein YecT (DUF1311 family)